MANLKLMQNGLRFLDSRGGDFLIVDPRLEMQLLFTSEFLQQAEEDPQKMMMLGKKLFDFLAKHTEARWRRVESDLIGLPQEFVDKYLPRLKTRTIDDLRKCEKDLFFWHKDHAKTN